MTETARKPRRATRRMAGLLGALSLAMTFAVTMSGPAEPASASAQGCTSASGGYVCTSVSGSGTWVDSVTAIRGKSGSICRSSAFAYVVYPWGQVAGLGYQARNNCAYGRAWFTFGMSRSFPSGSRICTKFMENDVPVGGEPCVRIG